MVTDEAVRDTLFTKKEQLEAQLEEIEEQLGIPNPAPWGASEWKENAIACIYNKKNYSTTIDVLKCLLSEGKYNRLSPDVREKYIVGLSVALNGLVKSGYLVSVKIPQLNKGYIYGLPEWFTKVVGGRYKLKIQFSPDHIKPVIDTINAKLMKT
jgi:hypothetical protein